MSAPATVVDAEFVEEPGRALAIADHAPPDLFGTSDPVEVVQKAVRVADALKAVVAAKGLISNIQGKQYPQVEAWQTLAAMLRLTSFTEWTREVEGGWEARCVVRDGSGRDLGAGEAQCTREEKAWKSRDGYALRSMAQTRATSKALRSVLAFVMVLAGYQPTPADEVPDGGFDDKPRGRRQAQPASTERPVAASVSDDGPPRVSKSTVDKIFAAFARIGADEKTENELLKAATGGTVALDNIAMLTVPQAKTLSALIAAEEAKRPEPVQCTACTGLDGEHLDDAFGPCINDHSPRAVAIQTDEIARERHPELHQSELL